MTLNEIAETPSVLLITAPGAMGKSAASLAIASKLNCPIVDVTRLPVGVHSLTGLLTSVLGWTQFPHYLQELQNGEACLVLDGLDEAQLKSGRDHYIAFIDDVASILRNSIGIGGQILMFGRTDAIETAYLQLTDRGISTSLATIQPLTHEQSCQLIDSTLDSFSDDGGLQFTVHRRFRVPFESMRDKILTDIAVALGADSTDFKSSWDQVAEFLGYPPVLLVLAEAMAVSNPSSASQVLNLSEQRSTRGELLRRIVEGILEREAEKVRKQLSDVLNIEIDDPRLHLIFTTEEQVLRLAAYLSRSPSEVLLPSPLEPAEKTLYEEHLTTFLPDHPFLKGHQTAGVVFSDYLRAYASTIDLGALHGVGRQEILEACPSLGPFFVHFIHGLAPVDPDTHQLRVIPESIIDDLLKSTLVGSSGRDMFVIFMGRSALHLTLIHDVNSDWEDEILAFVVPQPSGIVELTSPLGSGLIALNEGGLILRSSTSGEFQIGPGTNIFTDELEILATSLTVVGRSVSTDSDAIEHSMIFSQTPVRHDSQLQIQAHPPESLNCDWPNESHQWRPYKRTTPESATDIPTQKSWQLVIGIRKVFLTFKASVAGDPSIYGEMLDKLVVGRNVAYAVARDALIELDLVRKDGNRYSLNVARLAQYGINYPSLRTADPATTLASIYADVCKLDRVIAWAAT